MRFFSHTSKAFTKCISIPIFQTIEYYFNSIMSTHKLDGYIHAKFSNQILPEEAETELKAIFSRNGRRDSLIPVSECVRFVKREEKQTKFRPRSISSCSTVSGSYCAIDESEVPPSPKIVPNRFDFPLHSRIDEMVILNGIDNLEITSIEDQNGKEKEDQEREKEQVAKSNGSPNKNLGFLELTSNFALFISTLFTQFDFNKDGILDQKEVECMLNFIGLEDEIEVFDKNKYPDGVDFESFRLELLALMKRRFM